MKRVIKITESELTKIIKKIIIETSVDDIADMNSSNNLDKLMEILDFEYVGPVENYYNPNTIQNYRYYGEGFDIFVNIIFDMKETIYYVNVYGSVDNKNPFFNIIQKYGQEFNIEPSNYLTIENIYSKEFSDLLIKIKNWMEENKNSNKLVGRIRSTNYHPQ